MEKKLSRHVSHALKALIIIGFIMYGFSVNAQSITGKWKMTAAKEIVTDPSGHKQDLSAQMGDITKMVEQIIEFHTDNTYFLSNKMKGAKSGIEVNGKYSVAGNQLKLEPGKSNVQPVKSSSPMNNQLPNNVTIVSSNATTLVIHYGATTTDNGKNFTVDITDTFTKQ